MRLQPIIYTTDPAGVVDWYGRVLGVEPSYQSDVWTTFDLDGVTLAIHGVEDEPSTTSRVALSLVTESLDDAMERLASEGIEPTRGMQVETFGRSMLLTDPDGTVIQVNEHG